MRARFLAIFAVTLLVLAWGSAAEAAAAFTNCAAVQDASATVDAGTGLAQRQVGGTGGAEELCYDFDDATDSSAVILEAKTTRICFDPDEASDGAATGQVFWRSCIATIKPGSNPTFTCLRTSDTALTGAGGSPGTQAACIEVGRDVGYVEVSTSPAGDEARVMFTKVE